MPLQISEFTGTATDPRGEAVQVADGAPVSVSTSGFTGSLTMGVRTNLIRIKGTGSITWSGVGTPETFDGVEYRRVRPGDSFTVA